MITCAIDMFGHDQMIYYNDENGEKQKIKSNIEDLGTNIAKTCQAINDYDISIYASKAYVEKRVAPQIYKFLENKYDLSKVNIEVIL